MSTTAGSTSSAQLWCHGHELLLGCGHDLRRLPSWQAFRFNCVQARRCGAEDRPGREHGGRRRVRKPFTATDRARCPSGVRQIRRSCRSNSPIRLLDQMLTMPTASNSTKAMLARRAHRTDDLLNPREVCASRLLTGGSAPSLQTQVSSTGSTPGDAAERCRRYRSGRVSCNRQRRPDDTASRFHPQSTGRKKSGAAPSWRARRKFCHCPIETTDSSR